MNKYEKAFDMLFNEINIITNEEYTKCENLLKELVDKSEQTKKLLRKFLTVREIKERYKLLMEIWSDDNDC